MIPRARKTSSREAPFASRLTPRFLRPPPPPRRRRRSPRPCCSTCTPKHAVRGEHRREGFPHDRDEHVDERDGDEEKVERVLLPRVALSRAQRGHREHPHRPHAHEPRDVGLVRREQHVVRQQRADHQADVRLHLEDGVQRRALERRVLLARGRARARRERARRSSERTWRVPCPRPPPSPRWRGTRLLGAGRARGEPATRARQPRAARAARRRGARRRARARTRARRARETTCFGRSRVATTTELSEPREGRGERRAPRGRSDGNSTAWGGRPRARVLGARNSVRLVVRAGLSAQTEPRGSETSWHRDERSSTSRWDVVMRFRIFAADCEIKRHLAHSSGTSNLEVTSAPLPLDRACRLAARTPSRPAVDARPSEPGAAAAGARRFSPRRAPAAAAERRAALCGAALRIPRGHGGRGAGSPERRRGIAIAAARPARARRGKCPCRPGELASPDAQRARARGDGRRARGEGKSSPSPGHRPRRGRQRRRRGDPGSSRSPRRPRQTGPG